MQNCKPASVSQMCKPDVLTKTKPRVLFKPGGLTKCELINNKANYDEKFSAKSFFDFRVLIQGFNKAQSLEEELFSNFFMFAVRDGGGVY
ncbi:hypothetical protein GOBAR_DD32087 [Gossypium barbadense]|nr:hypothetical protein GOBAR_DD32087 [Gossypium barbadense]